MTNKKVTRKALLMSITSLLICISMLMGTTFAWFTDEVTSGVNKIVAGNLDVELYHQNAKVKESTLVESDTKLFDVNIEGNEILWEPGAIAYETLTVKNVGTLAFKYRMLIAQYGFNSVTRSTETKSLLDVLKVHIKENETFSGNRAAAKDLFTDADKTLGEYLNDTVAGSLTPENAAKNYTVFIYWPDSNSDNVDNFYNLKNDGWTLDRQLDGKDTLYVDLGVTIVAAQVGYEKDSFGNDYDSGSELPKTTSASATETVTADKATTLTVLVAPEENKSTTVTLTNAEENGALDTATSATLDVKTTDVLNSSREFNITGTSATNEAVAATIDLTLTLTKTITEGQSTTTQTAQATDGFIAKVETYVAKNLSNVSIKYNGTSGTFSNAETTPQPNEAAVDAVGEYFYDAVTGKLVFITDHFSQYLVGTTSVAYLDQDSDGNDINTAYLTVDAALKDAKVKDPNWEVPSVKLLNNATYIIPDGATEVKFWVAKNGKSFTVEPKDGYSIDEKLNTDGVNTEITISNAVCEVTSLNNQDVSKKYTSLQSAFNSVPENDKNAQITIKLLQDITLPSGEWTNYVKKSVTNQITGETEMALKLATDITINLNGHTLKAVDNYNPLQIKCEDAITATMTDSSTKVKLHITDSAETKGSISYVRLRGVEMTIAEGITYDKIWPDGDGDSTNTINGVTLTNNNGSNKTTTP